MRSSHIAYAPLFGPISADNAQAESAADQLFIEPGPYPKIVISTQVVIDGLVLNVTLHDTSITEAVALLKRRTAAPPNTALCAAPKRRRGRPRKPVYEALWMELD